jgi:sugar phosphate permease
VSLASIIGVLAFAAIPTVLMTDIGINTEQFGLYNVILILVLMIISFPAGLLAQRYGGKRIVFAGQMSIALSNFVFGLASNYPEQIISRLILGVGASFWWVAAPENVVLTFGKRGSAFPLSVWLTGYATGAAICYPLTVIGAESIGWRLTFLLFGFLSLAIAGVYLFKVKVAASAVSIASPTVPSLVESTRNDPLFGQKKRDNADNNSKRGSNMSGILPPQKTVWLIALAMFLQYTVSFGVLTFFPLYLVQNGFNLLQSGFLTFGLTIVGVPSMVLGGLLSIRLKKTAPILLIGLSLLSMVFLLPPSLFLFNNFPIFFYVIIGTVGVGLVLPDISWIFLSQVLSASGEGSVSFGLVNAIALAGAVLGTFIPAVEINNWGWTLIWVVSGFFVLGSLTVAIFLRRAENLWLKTYAHPEPKGA